MLVIINFFDFKFQEFQVKCIEIPHYQTHTIHHISQILVEALYQRPGLVLINLDRHYIQLAQL
jgi:hypothetical protein